MFDCVAVVGATGAVGTIIRELLEARNRVGAQAKCLLREALLRQGLGGRGYVRTINLARTIADLDAVSDVTADHVAEALSLRLDYRRIGFG